MRPLGDRMRAALATGPGGRPPPELIGEDAAHLPEFQNAARIPAAVLVAITDRREPGLILTVRSDTMRRHAGQIAFPGGRIDPEDDGPIAAALREAEEEIGLPPGLVDVVGTTDRYRTITGFEVTPVIGVVPPDLPLYPHEAEVADWFEAPLAFVLDPANHHQHEAELRGIARRYIEVTWQGRRIWGATAAMLVNVGRRLGTLRL